MHLIIFDIDGTLVDTASDSVSRIEIIQLAERRALNGRSAARRTYFGDGPWDKRASEALGYDFVAVGDSVEHRTRYADLSARTEILVQLGLAG